MIHILSSTSTINKIILRLSSLFRNNIIIIVIVIYRWSNGNRVTNFHTEMRSLYFLVSRGFFILSDWTMLCTILKERFFIFFEDNILNRGASSSLVFWFIIMIIIFTN